jgi:hypothetical protein
MTGNVTGAVEISVPLTEQCYNSWDVKKKKRGKNF